MKGFVVPAVVGTTTGFGLGLVMIGLMMNFKEKDA